MTYNLSRKEFRLTIHVRGKRKILEIMLRGIVFNDVLVDVERDDVLVVQDQ